ncbi:MAG: hypothetical protein MAGBODY4_00132 [Candidatus Marinimicrobia bacterium]|nr:hypothetical protein [Candidatus Neomarinimicrobiota bacterium]
MNKMYGRLIGISLLALIVGCSGSKESSEITPEMAEAPPDTTQSRQEVLEKKRVNVLEMQTKIDILHDEIGNLKREISRLKDENKSLQNRLREQVSEGQVTVNGQKEPVEIDSMSDTYRELLITQNLQAAENAAIAADIRRADTLYNSKDLTGMLDPIDDDEYRERYNEALSEYFQKNYYRSIAEFQTLLIIDKGNEYADNAQYWIGESYYSMGDYSKAVTEFERVLDFERSNKKDHAQFKIALCQLKLGNRAAARNAFDTLKEEYPNSELLARVTEYMGDPSYNVQ